MKRLATYSVSDTMYEMSPVFLKRLMNEAAGTPNTTDFRTKPIAGTPFTIGEDEFLKVMLEEGATHFEIGEKLGREGASVGRRVQVLGLSRKRKSRLTQI